MTRHIAAIALFLMLDVLAGASIAAQERPGVGTNAPPAEIERLGMNEQVVLDGKAGTAERSRAAKLILLDSSTAKRDLVIRLLSRTDQPDVQQITLSALAEYARTHGEILGEDMVPLLMSLLQHDRDDIRTPAAGILSLINLADVYRQLGEIARDSTKPVPVRTAAVDALAPNVHRLEVIQQLVEALAVSTGPLAEHVGKALEPASTEPIGNDAESWREWLRDSSRYSSNEERLAAQIKHYRARYDAASREALEQRAAMDDALSAAEERLSAFQSELAWSLSSDQRRGRLIEWLRDPLPSVVRTALSIIKDEMADEGVRPGEELLTALLGLLRSADDDLRARVLTIVQYVNDPQVMDEVLRQLQEENNETMRLALLTAAGELNMPGAITALVEEIQSPDATTGCVSVAAQALDKLASFPNKANADAVTAALNENADIIATSLLNRYTECEADDTQLRAALLAAMAGVGRVIEDASLFRAEFEEAVNEDDPSIIGPALRGLQALGERGQIARIRNLTAHAEQTIRLDAVDAIGALAAEDADLECLLMRVNPAGEPDAMTRDSAWKGIKAYMAGKPLDQRLNLSERLRDMPDLEAEYLDGLVSTTQPGEGTFNVLAAAYRRLAGIFANRGDHVRSSTYFGKLFQMQMQRGESGAVNTAVQWLAVTLRGFPKTNPGEVVVRFAETGPAVEQWDRMTAELRRYVESSGSDEDHERTRQLVQALHEADADNIAPQWRGLVKEWRDRVIGRSPTATNGHDSDG